MFIPQTGQAVIRIPKTGSSSLDEMIHETYDRKKCDCYGHMTAREIAERLDRSGKLNTLKEFVVVVRNPVDRLVSALNYLHGGKQGHDLNTAMEDAARVDEAASIAYRPQYTFLDYVGYVPYRIFAYDYGGVEKAAKRVGCETPMRHDNPSAKRWTTKEVLGHPRLVEVMKKYSIDETLYTYAVVGKEIPPLPVGIHTR